MTRAAVVLLFFLSTCPALAVENAWGVLERFGLTDVWAPDCRKHPTVTYFHVIFSQDADGLARLKFDFGLNHLYLSFVDNAEVVSPSTIKLRGHNADPKYGPINNKAFELSLVKQNDPNDPQSKEMIRIRYLDARYIEGRVVVKGGIRLSDGKPVGWLYKCRSAIS